VLVWQDLLGLTPQPHPRFVNEYLNMRTLIRTAVSVWQDDVKTGETPNEDQDYK
jgi:3-methyl-2-oxobutanoate hydroxymethyltransferase